MYNINYLRPQIVNVWKIIVYVNERVNSIERGEVSKNGRVRTSENLH